jgi:hypothetical protein
MKKFLLIFYICVLFTSCATIPEPTTNKNTLLIGQIIYNGERFAFHPFNGTYKSGIAITFQYLGTKTTTTLSTDNEGTFTSIDLPDGEYLIKKVCLDVANTGDYEGRVYGAPNRNDLLKTFTIKFGHVNNIGVINWNSVAADKANMSYSNLSFNKSYDQVHNFFLTRYPDSGWLKKEWANVSYK